MLIAARHITTCREQAIGIAPFEFPEDVRKAALWGVGWEMDDNATYDRARLAMAFEGRAVTQYLVANREEIMKKYAACHPVLGG